MDLTNLGEPPSKIAKVKEWIDKVHNVHFSIEERWQEAIKDINFEFTDHQCYCELDWIATDDKPNKPPNMWCENATYWKTQYIPCCCQHFCDAKINLIEIHGPCECSRCCVCQLTNTRCENCLQKNFKYQKCRHIDHYHTPCLFHTKLFQMLDDINTRDNLHNVLINATSDEELDEANTL